MKFTGKQLHQGDTQWFEIDGIPKNAKKVEKQFVAESERSGSMHALCGNYDMYEVEGGFIVDVLEESIINHSLKTVLQDTGVALNSAKILPKKDHRHSVLEKGQYFVGIQQRFDPLSAAKEKVRD